MRTKATSILLILMVALAGAVVAQETEKWIHIRVEENAGGEDAETVTVNLPLSMVSAAAALVPEEVSHEATEEMEIALDDLKLSWSDLVKFWQEVKAAPEATFVTVQTKDENIVVKKKGEYLLIKTTEATEHGANVNVKFPLAVVDALFSGEEGKLNWEAAIQALAQEEHGNLVTVQEGDESVRIWIDDQNEVK